MNELFFELAIVIITAGLFSLLVHRLKQPLIIGYILTGIVVGPGLLGLTKSMDLLQTLSSIGIAFLLFIVGLNLNWRNIKEVGKLAVVLGLSQVLITGATGWLIARALTIEPVTAIFIGMTFAFSSTIIVVKMLSDKEDIDRLYGRIAVGMLIVQDLIAMVLLLGFSAFVDGGSWTAVVTESVGKMIVVVGVLVLLAKYVVPHLFRYAAKSTELLFVLAIAWCFAVASALSMLGFGIELGALLAGLSLAGTGFQHEIEAKVRVLRDFFLLIFFIVLGTQLLTGNIGALLLPAVVLSGFVMFGNPLIVLGIMRLMGYHPRTGFMVGTTVGQISEFTFIMLGAAVAADIVPQDALALATIVGLITIAGSTYLISYNERIFELLAKTFPWLIPAVKDYDRRTTIPQIVLIGYDRMGQKILPMVEDLTDNFVVVDYNPTVTEDLERRGINAVYGDASSEDLLKFVHADRTKLLISAIPDMEVNEDICDFLKRRRSTAAVILTVKSSEDAARCYALGATFVIVPTIMGGEHFANLLKKMKTAKGKWGSLGKKELESL